MVSTALSPSDDVKETDYKSSGSGSTAVDSENTTTFSQMRHRVDTASSTASTSTTDTKISSQDTRTSSSRRKPKRNRSYINVAPLNTPLSHRLETVGVIWHCISIPFFLCLFLFLISLGWIVWLTIILPYFIWWYGFDLHTPTNGKGTYRVRNSMKNLIIWEWFVNYFPIRCYKTVDLEPTFDKVLLRDTGSSEDDEQDLISESSLTSLDHLFKFLGLKKRINTADDAVSIKSNSSVYKKVSSGPRYIFGYHPHGVISMGAVGLFGTNALRNEPYEPVSKWLKPFFHDPSKHTPLFPGIGKIFPLTLTTQFTIPFYRDYLMALGISSASAKNIKSLITNGDNSICLVVGGAQESLLNNMIAKNSRIGYGYREDNETEESDEKSSSSNSNNNSNSHQTKTSESPHREVKLVLNKRKGFVKLAIELGNVSLVPTFAFGEADVYRLTVPPPGSLGYKFQQWMKKTFAFTVPFFSARGVFIYDFGFLPYRNPINIVVGKPIHIPEGILQDYRLNHPEEFEDEIIDAKGDLSKEKEEEDGSPSTKMEKTGSFTDFLTLKKKLVPKPRPKVPQKLLDHYHKQYVDELKRVYNDNKDKFGYGEVALNIVE
ncbi:DGA1 [Candida oxycetoniae]|uniref:diacylglycerol O-acyltransferase n=1 Tax=Candida oxycetoniae TaxID=497107 RepID=A0AAI9SU88_9ASCO|nr:DGA1 [Candida oxycetoniae]KAI3402609.2 DGA1 [Candida oxycetoniae]